MKGDSPLKGIFFDAGNTLFEAKESIGFYYSQMAARYGIEIEAKRLDQRFKNTLQKAPPLAFPDADEAALPQLEFEWWHELVRGVFSDIDFPYFDLFFKELYAFFESENVWRLFPETQSVLASLKKSAFTLGIISNFDSRLISICKHLGIHDFFDIIVFSSQTAVAKPEPGIFEHTLKEAGLNPSECIYVGDHFKNDVTGPSALGMKALLLDRRGLHSALREVTTIRDLRAVYHFLD